MTLAPATGEAPRLRPTDYLILVTLVAALYGTAALSGRPLSIHEARIPQLAREMASGHGDWILPQSAGRPWLERPPLPHWFTAASMAAFGRTDSLWVARLPAALMGGLIVLTGAWMSARWFGRQLGLLAGMVIATSYELYQYSTLAEDDIYLGAVAVACMAMFVRSEWPSGEQPNEAIDAPPRAGLAEWARAFVGWREWSTVLFFVLLGLTNLAKGPLVGALPIIGTVGAFLLWNRDARRVRHFTWLWGWLIFLALTAAWPWWAQRHYPDIWDNWRFDYVGQYEGGDPSAARQWDEPVWHYLEKLPGALAPWTVATVIGLAFTARRAWSIPRSPERFLWCWAWAGLIVLSLPARKHHHYLVPIITPWAILAAMGLLPVGRWLMAADPRERGRKPMFGLLVLGVPGAVALALLHGKLPGGAGSAAVLAAAWLGCVGMFYVGLSRADTRWLVASIVVGFVVCAGWVQLVVAGRDERTRAQMDLLRQVEAAVPAGELVRINSDVASLEFFRLQFSLRRPSELLHNLTYLRDRDLSTPVVYVVTRAEDEPGLAQLGDVTRIAQESPTRREPRPGQRFSLFRVVLSPELARYPRPPYVGVMQAMGRKRGPWCGNPWESAIKPVAAAGRE
jgi:4-amino-4-deoxy-L-arabinose transferase-like glycosyltransferase